MDITWGWIKNMKLRNKLALVYTVVFTLILGISYIFIFSFSEKNREELSYKKLSERIITSFKLMQEVEQINDRSLKVVDLNGVNSADRILFLFDASGRMIYSNADSRNAQRYVYLLQQLKNEDKTIQSSDGVNELLAMRFTDKGKTYYGIAKGYDLFGRRKIHFLAVSLIITFIIVTAAIVVLSLFLSKIITKPISRLAGDIEKMSPEDLSRRVRQDFANDEIGFLSSKFNELLDKVENAFKFQYHYINHISHELKTPLAIMMANAERSLTGEESEQLKASMQFQKNAIMDLSNIINAMLDISKMEKKLAIGSETIRIDEIIFQCMDEITYLNSNVNFDFNIDNTVEESDLIIAGNSRMIKMTVMNLIKNAVNFSSNSKPSIEIAASHYSVSIKITNDGPTITTQEQLKLFRHSFRGANSTSVKGFGLGLVLSHRIVTMHKGSLNYTVVDGTKNCFVLSLPTKHAAVA